MNMRTNEPLPKNDPKLMELVRAIVVKPFCVGGQRQEIGATVKIERCLAEGLVKMGKAEFS